VGVSQPTYPTTLGISMGFNKPCLDCGKLTRNGTRCEYHQGLIDAKTNQRKAERTHYRGDYPKRAKAIRDTATNCWLCGEGYRPNDPWTADHVYPSMPDSPLMPAHRSCNSRRGNKPMDTHQ
jgi:hypothetical protein